MQTVVLGWTNFVYRAKAWRVVSISVILLVNIDVTTYVTAGLIMRYPLGVQTFSKIIEEQLLYVDKTAIIYELLRGGSVYFLSRPRRFGKSLLISTLEALFSGQKALFEGLAIADTDYDFITYPVIRLDFSGDEFITADDLRAHISIILNDYARKYEIELNLQTFAKRFMELVVKLHEKTGQKVVLLVDEYDKPILSNLKKSNLKKPVLDEIKAVMSAFYATVKAQDEHLKFVFITGVSKFAKISIFSGMNSLTDLTLHKRYATLCGITEQELEHYFVQPITMLAEEEQMDKQQLLGKIKHWYNGYQFHPRAAGVYNPFSLLSLFEFEEFKNYWYSTATPTFLLDLLQHKQYDLATMGQLEVSESAFVSSEPEDMDVLSLFVQTGYLTIKGYRNSRYTLDFPNYEVKRSFFDSVATRYGRLEKGLGDIYIYDLVDDLNAGNLNNFFKTLKVFFANIPYELAVNREKYYQSLFYAILTMIGLSIDAEVSTNQGRIDCVIQTEDTIYIIEFKLNDTKEEALKQINDKQYIQKYQRSGKAIVLLGVEFDQKSRNIGDYLRHDLAAV